MRIWERTKYDAVKERKDRRRGAKAEGKREDRDDRKAWCAEERAKGVACFASDGVEQLHLLSPLNHELVDVVCFAAVRLVVAEPASRLALGFVAREVLTRHDVVDASFEVEAQLVIELGVDALA
jgi:hypothetical protein